jgi:hypothetical protein
VATSDLDIAILCRGRCKTRAKGPCSITTGSTASYGDPQGIKGLCMAPLNAIPL